MIRYTIINIFLLLCLYGVSFSESVDISNDLQKNSQVQPTAPLQSAMNPLPPQSSTAPGGAEEMKDIFDIKPLEKIGYDKRMIKYAVGILIIILIVCLLIYLIDYFVRRRKKETIEEVSIIPADVEAFTLLDELKKNRNLNAREYYFRLTAILRGYIGKRFEIDAPEMTTEELLPKLNNIDCEKKLKFNVKSVLTSTDPVKYAGADVLQDKMENDFQIVTDFVRMTPLTVPDTEGADKDV